jgi:hypothetical protein
MKLPSEQEQQLQDEIRKRILEAAQQKDDQETHTEETQATLDALESIIDMPREEMERIAKTVEKEFKYKQPTHFHQTGWMFNIFLIGLGATTWLLFRRGSLFYLLFGASLITAIYLKWRKRK